MHQQTLGLFLILSIHKMALAGAVACETPHLSPALRPQPIVENYSYQGTGQSSETPINERVLDIYAPARAKKPFKTVMLIHGGCFQWGDKDSNDNVEQIKRLTAAGYAVVAIDYRLAHPSDSDPKLRHPYPDSWVDSQAAVSWVRANGARFGLDTSKLVAMGYSAGGTLADYLGTRPIESDSQKSAPVTAVIDMFGRTDFQESFRHEVHDSSNRDCGEEYLEEQRTRKDARDFLRASVLDSVRLTRAKFLILHGDQDTNVSNMHSCLLFRKLSDRHEPPDLAKKFCKITPHENDDCFKNYQGDRYCTITGAKHMFSCGNEMDRAWSQILPFLKSVFSEPDPKGEQDSRPLVNSITK